MYRKIPYRVCQGGNERTKCGGLLRELLFRSQAAALFSFLFWGESDGAGHGEKMKIHAPVMAVKIRHEAGERMTGKAAAFIKLVEIGEKTAGIVLRHAGKGILCGDENGVAQKAEQERVPAVLNDASAAIENLSAGREDADGDICQPSEGIAVSRFRKAAGGWKAEGFIRLQPDGAPFWQMAEEGDILRKIFGLRAVEFHAHLRHEADRVVFQHLPGDVSLFGPVGDSCQKLLYLG